MTHDDRPETSPLARIARALRGRIGFWTGVAITAFWVICAFLAWSFVPHDPFQVNTLNQLAAPSTEHIFGTDALGRDVFSRVLTGSRDVLMVAVAAAGIATSCGAVVGAIIGYFGGWIDLVLSRFTEAVLSIPSVILALMVLAIIGPSPLGLILTIAFVDTWVVARTVRAAVQKVKRFDYVDAAWLRGERALSILVREIVPNLLPVLVVELTTRISFAVFTVASLSFLGFGVQPPSPDWGLQVADAYGLLAAGYWWPTLFPALGIGTLVVGISAVSSGLAAGGPRSRRARADERDDAEDMPSLDPVTASAARPTEPTEPTERNRTPWPDR